MKDIQSNPVACVGIKICAVCGAVNRDFNQQCYNCSWGGAFDVDAGHIQQALTELDGAFRHDSSSTQAGAVDVKAKPPSTSFNVIDYLCRLFGGAKWAH